VDANLGRAGPEFAFVIVGSVLENITKGLIRAPLHRVVSTRAELASERRIAGTFFFQPRPEDPLALVPSALVAERDAVAEPEPVQSYRAWKARAYGNYYKSKQKKKMDRQASNRSARVEQQ